MGRPPFSVKSKVRVLFVKKNQLDLRMYKTLWKAYPFFFWIVSTSNSRMMFWRNHKYRYYYNKRCVLCNEKVLQTRFWIDERQTKIHLLHLIFCFTLGGTINLTCLVHACTICSWELIPDWRLPFLNYIHRSMYIWY